MSVELVTADGYKVTVEVAKGPASTTTVGTGAVANIDLAVAPGRAVVMSVLGVRTVEGVPDGLVLMGVSYPDVKTVRITVKNVSGAALTVAANAVTATVLAKSL